MKAGAPAFSILIPTYNRRHKLSVVLQALKKQPELSQGEVIVGIDGSSDGTQAYLEELQDNFPAPLRFFWIENSGRSVIRNQLLDRAQGDLVIFIQDDIVVDEGWLAAHLAAQRAQEGAVVGFMTWYPEAEVTPYMQWLEHGGHMLDFAGMIDGEEIDFWHFYMGNLSVPRRLIEELRFEEQISAYGWEDILFGYAFTSQGGKVYYSASARAFHWDEYQEEGLQKYMHQVGKSAVVAEQLYPGVGFVPPRWKQHTFRAMISVGRVARPLLPQRWRWYLDMKRWFLEACRNPVESLSSD